MPQDEVDLGGPQVFTKPSSATRQLHPNACTTLVPVHCTGRTVGCQEHIRARSDALPERQRQPGDAPLPSSGPPNHSSGGLKRGRRWWVAKLRRSLSQKVWETGELVAQRPSSTAWKCRVRPAAAAGIRTVITA